QRRERGLRDRGKRTLRTVVQRPPIAPRAAHSSRTAWAAGSMRETVGRSKPPPRRWHGFLSAAAGTVLVLAGGALLVGLLAAPERVEYVYGTVKTAVTGSIHAAREDAF